MSRCRMVTPLFSGPENSGMCLLTGSLSLSLPRSINTMMQGVVATTLVNEAASNMVVFSIGLGAGTMLRLPYARW